MRQIFKTLRRAAIVALTCTGTVAGDGYLPKVGPTALRFQARSAVADVTAVLPPLQMEDVKPVEQDSDAEFIGPQLPEDPGPQERDMVEIESFPGTALEPAPPDVQGQPETQQVPLTPQVFMRFFNQSGRRETVVEAPVEFTPPTPRSSRATYLVK